MARKRVTVIAASSDGISLLASGWYTGILERSELDEGHLA